MSGSSISSHFTFSSTSSSPLFGVMGVYAGCAGVEWDGVVDPLLRPVLSAGNGCDCCLGCVGFGVGAECASSDFDFYFLFFRMSFSCNNKSIHQFLALCKYEISMTSCKSLVVEDETHTMTFSFLG